MGPDPSIPDPRIRPAATDDDELRAIIRDPLVEIYVLYLGGVPAGYVELDRRVKAEIELVYLGLSPEFTGRGLGRYPLDWAIHTA